MRILIAIAVFVGSLVVMTIACTWGWDRFISGTLYVCTDSVPFDFLHPGDWVHKGQKALTIRDTKAMKTIGTASALLVICFNVGGAEPSGVIEGRVTLAGPPRPETRIDLTSHPQIEAVHPDGLMTRRFEVG